MIPGCMHARQKSREFPSQFVTSTISASFVSAQTLSRTWHIRHEEIESEGKRYTIACKQHVLFVKQARSGSYRDAFTLARPLQCMTATSVYMPNNIK